MHNELMLIEMFKKIIGNKFISLATVCALAAIYITSNPNQQLNEIILNHPSAAIHYLYNSNIKVSDTLGEYSYQISADEITVSQERDALFINVIFTYQNFILKANTGQLNENDNIFELNERVTLSRNNSAQDVITAEHLSIDLTKGLAFTDSQVQINYNNGYMISSGLITDFNNTEIDLPKDVYGEFYR